MVYGDCTANYHHAKSICGIHRGSIGEYFVGYRVDESHPRPSDHAIATATDKYLCSEYTPRAEHYGVYRLWDALAQCSDGRRTNAYTTSQKSTIHCARHGHLCASLLHDLATWFSTLHARRFGRCSSPLACLWETTTRRQSTYYRHPVSKQGYHTDS